MGALADRLSDLKKKGKLRGKKQKAKFATVMHEWGQGGLHSGSKKGPLVAHPSKGGQKQALAIAFSEAKKAS